MNENAKNDWLNVVKRHKKKQKGLPALSTLNTNAGNVEKNIEMFNAMQVDGNISVDASNGNSSSMGESLTSTEKITLEYTDLPVRCDTTTRMSDSVYDISLGQYYPADRDIIEVPVNWKYTVDKDDVIEFLQDLEEVQAELWLNDMSSEEYQDQVVAQFDILFEKYNDKILEYFYDRACDDADKRYKYQSDLFEEIYNTSSSNKTFDADDTFDMSMRTLL